jgi:hypothetical protein
LVNQTTPRKPDSTVGTFLAPIEGTNKLRDTDFGHVFQSLNTERQTSQLLEELAERAPGIEVSHGRFLPPHRRLMFLRSFLTMIRGKLPEPVQAPRGDRERAPPAPLATRRSSTTPAVAVAVARRAFAPRGAIVQFAARGDLARMENGIRREGSAGVNIVQWAKDEAKEAESGVKERGMT